MAWHGASSSPFPLIREGQCGRSGGCGNAVPPLTTPNPSPQGRGEEFVAPPRSKPAYIWSSLAITFLAHFVVSSVTPACAAETIIAGGVSSGSTNLWPIHIGIRKGLFQAVDLKIDLVFAQSNASVIQQLAANSINVSVGSGLVDPIRAVEKGAPVALIRIETQKPPYALLAKPAKRTDC